MIGPLFGAFKVTSMFTGIVEALGVVESIQRVELNQAHDQIGRAHV